MVPCVSPLRSKSSTYHRSSKTIKWIYHVNSTMPQFTAKLGRSLHKSPTAWRQSGWRVDWVVRVRTGYTAEFSSVNKRGTGKRKKFG